MSHFRTKAITVPGSDHEPTAPPEEAAVQMREATERLREQGWKMAPIPAPDTIILDTPQPADI